MKLLEALGLRKPPPSDPIFRFKKFYGFQSPYWEAEAEFAPVGRVVEVLVSCPRSGANPMQHSFYRELEARYTEVLAAAHSALSAELSPPGQEVPTTAALNLVCISVSEAPPSLEWELSFEAASAVHYSVAFQGWSPARVEISRC
jgi:hypothetical protein